MAKKIVPAYVRLIHKIANGEDCRPDWVAHVKEQLARCSDDPDAEPAEPLQGPARTRLSLAYVNANPPSRQQPEPDYVARCRVYDELVSSGAFWNDRDAVSKAFADLNARKATIEGQSQKLTLAWSRD